MAQLLKRGPDRWQVLVFKGRTAAGKRQFHIRTIRGTKKAALAYAREIETAVTTGAFAEPTKQSVGDFLSGWLNGTATQRLRPPTVASYRKLVNTYITPVLGERKLAQLRLPEVDKLYADMRARGLSPRTVRYTHSILRTALNHAVRARLVIHNATDYASLPRQERKEMRCLSPAETVRFLAAAKEDQWYALFEVLTLTGLRPGEALGLKWGDLTENGISVQRALVSAGRDWTTAEPKTRRSRRTVPLAGSTIKALQTHRRAQAEEKLRAGPSYNDSGFMFASATGAPLDIKNLTERHFKKILRGAELPPLTLYGLRHTAATLMLSAGVNAKVASERLGHSTVLLTMDCYSHVLPHMQHDAVERVERLLAAAAQ